MTIVLAHPIAHRTEQPSPDRRLRRQERRRRTEHERRIDQIVALHAVRDVLGGARALVDAGWIRHGWFAYDADGVRHVVTAHNAGRLGGRPVSAACLVGAVVQAGGGLDAVHTQPVQRALDLAWHTLVRDPGEAVRWCPAPSVRMAHVRDLTRWNDHPERTAADVSDLLARAATVATSEMDRLTSPVGVGWSG